MPAKLEKTDANGKPLPRGIFRRGSRYVFFYRINGEQRWESCRSSQAAVRAKRARETRMERAEFEQAGRIGKDEGEAIRALTREQFAALLEAVGPRWRTLFDLLASTGIRISEAIALQWRHVHVTGSSPHIHVCQRIVRGKLGPLKSEQASRRIPISHELVISLVEQRRLSEWPRDIDYVFASGAGAPLSPLSIRRRVLKPAADAAEVPWIGFRTFRHTCAMLLFAEGRSIVQVQRWLGHHDASFTLRTYISLLDDDDLGGPLSPGGSAMRPHRRVY